MVWSSILQRLSCFNVRTRQYFTSASVPLISRWQSATVRQACFSHARGFVTFQKSGLAVTPLQQNRPLVFPVKYLSNVRRHTKGRYRTRGRRSKEEQFLRNPATVENGTDQSFSIAAEMLIQTDRPVSTNKFNGGETRIDKDDATFLKLEELASIRVREAIPVIEDFSEDEKAVLNDEELSQPLLRTSGYASRSMKKIEFYGTPDPSVPMSKVPCHGCGAVLHCKDPGIPGYLPSQKFLSTPESQLKDVKCQRCHLLNSHHIAIDVAIGPSDYEAVLTEIKQKVALVIVVVDLTDLPNSFYKEIPSLIGSKRPIYIIGNKVDLLPKDDEFYLQRIHDSLHKLCEDYGLSKVENVKHVALISAKTGYGIEELITHLLRDWSLKGQVYILGCANAGKSTLFNALLSSDFCRSSARDILHRATTSRWPGTTLNLLKFPIVNPKPALLHKRIERLEKRKSEALQEKQLRRKSLRASGYWQHATLMGHIGTSFSTPKEVAINTELSKYSSFVIPSYTFSDVDPENLKQFPGTDGLLDHLNLKVEPYKDTTFKYWCYDTPGLINPEQIVNLLNPEELSVVLSNKLILPRTFLMKPNQVMFISGLSRIDYTQGEVPIYFTVFASEKIPVHVLNSSEADAFYDMNIGTPTLGVPLGSSDRRAQIPYLKGKDFTMDGFGWKESVADIVLSSLGWVSVTAGVGRSVTLTAYTPDGRGCTLRTPSLLKYAINQRGKRIKGTPAYMVRAPKMG